MKKFTCDFEPFCFEFEKQKFPRFKDAGKMTATTKAQASLGFEVKLDEARDFLGTKKRGLI